MFSRGESTNTYDFVGYSKVEVRIFYLVFCCYKKKEEGSLGGGRKIEI
jgi:hypothetical protein